MRDPRPLLESLLWEGEQLEERLRQRLPAPARKKMGSLARKAARGAGIHPVLQEIGALMVTSEQKKVLAQEGREVDAFLDRIQHLLTQVSTAAPSMPLRGNSSKLVGRIATAREKKQPLTRVSAANRLLASLAKRELVFNDDIPTYLKRLQAEKEADRRAKRELKLLDLTDLPAPFAPLKFANRAAVLEPLSAYPNVREAMEGALHAGAGDAPDGRAQALVSCRRAMETLGKEFTGTSNWREIVLAVGDVHIRDLLKKLYSLLSEKGAHGGSRAPAPSTVTLGIHLTFGLLFWMLENRDAIRAASGLAKSA